MRSIIISDDPETAHAEGPEGQDYTLCGYAYEGEDGDAELIHSKRRIDCPRCIAIISAAKRIKARDIAPVT